jgi:hypothetical protein
VLAYDAFRRTYEKEDDEEASVGEETLSLLTDIEGRAVRGGSAECPSRDYQQQNSWCLCSDADVC